MIPQQDTQKALIEQLRRLADEREATGADDPCPIDVECDHCDTVRAMREAADALEALSESSASEETPLAGLKERLRVALTEKSFHSCRVGPMHGPMRDEPAILLSNAIDVLCNVMDASSETQEDRSGDQIETCAQCGGDGETCHVCGGSGKVAASRNGFNVVWPKCEEGLGSERETSRRIVVRDGLRELAAELRLGHGITKDAAIRLLHNAATLLDARSPSQPAETNEALAACQSQAGGRERAAFEAGCYARPAGDGWTFEAPSDSQARAAAEAYAAYEAQSSPSPSAETPPSPTISVEASRLLKLLANKGFTCDCGLGEDDIDEVVAFLKQVAELGHAHPLTTREEE